MRYWQAVEKLHRNNVRIECPVMGYAINAVFKGGDVEIIYQLGKGSRWNFEKAVIDYAKKHMKEDLL